MQEQTAVAAYLSGKHLTYCCYLHGSIVPNSTRRWPNVGLAFSARGSSLDVRIWRLKTIPALKEWKKMYNSREPHNIGIQIKLKEL